MLSTPQIELLHFTSDGGSARTRCVARLAKLTAHGYLDRIEQPQVLSQGRKPYLHCLSAKGAQLVADGLGCERSELDWTSKDGQLSPLFHEHLIATNQIRIRIEQAASRNGLEIRDWQDERSLKRAHSKDLVTITGPHGGTQRVAIIPDGFFILRTPRGSVYVFLECDRRTETARASRFEQADWQKKIVAYNGYRSSGLFQKRYGSEKGFRVLTVTTSERRERTLKEATEQANGRRRFWFTTLDFVNTHDPLIEPIWLLASTNERVPFLGDE